MASDIAVTAQRLYYPITYTRHDKERMGEESGGLPSADVRSPFERDRSRILHSAAFRRLQGKTQVFAPSESDFYRTRLTHSLEVAQIGKGLALRLGADVDLVEAACLVHDIGHPPFGHTGESELKQLMKSDGGFEANAQNLRILTRLESKSVDYEGLNLSRAVIDGQLKYKELFRDGLDKFVYQDDGEVVSWAGEEASSEFSHFAEHGKQLRSFECEIMNLADDIAFSVHDLEDSIHAGYVDAHTFYGNDRRIDKVLDKVEEEFKYARADVWQVYDRLVKNISTYIGPSGGNSGALPHRRRKSRRKELTSFLIGRYINAACRQDRSSAKGAVSDRYRYNVVMPIEYSVEIKLLRQLVYELVIRSERLFALEEKAKFIVRKLFEKFTGEEGYYLLPDDWREIADDEGRCTSLQRVACDYISGMTDDYALKTYSRLFLPGQGSIFDI